MTAGGQHVTRVGAASPNSPSGAGRAAPRRDRDAPGRAGVDGRLEAPAKRTRAPPVSPRRHPFAQDQDQTDQARRHVLRAARALLAEAPAGTAFTVDAVARKADMTPGTVCWQFGSVTGLLEALCDSLAEAGQMSALATAFADPDSDRALHGFVASFGRFWAVDRVAMRRLRALAALDPEVGAVMRTRDLWRWEGLQLLVPRLLANGRASGAPTVDHTVRVLYALTGFEMFDALARPGQDLSRAVPDVLELARAVIRPGSRS